MDRVVVAESTEGRDLSKLLQGFEAPCFQLGQRSVSEIPIKALDMCRPHPTHVAFLHLLHATFLHIMTDDYILEVTQI